MKKLLLLSFLAIFLLSSCDDDPVVEPVDECTLTEEESNVVEELNEVIHPFTSSAPSAAKEELAALDAQFAQSRIVAMGEGTHGTFEFFEMKHRLFKYLVEEHNYKAIVFEANFANTLVVNEYVLNGTGELDDVVANMNFWTWNTDEVKALIIWMRGYNIGKPDSEKIFFYGSDCQYKDDEIVLVLDYLSQVDTSYHTIADSLYKSFKEISSFSYVDEPDSVQIAILHNINSVVAHLESKESDYIANSDAKSYELALQTAKVIVQVEEVLSRRNPYARDKYMGENTVWWSNYIGNDAKVAFWAHNYHIMTTDWGWNTAGSQIEDMIGSEFINIGFSHSKGRFNAVHKVNGVNTLSEHQIEEAECNSFNFVFEHSSSDRFYLILDEVESSETLNDWLSKEQRFMMIGAVYDRTAPENYYLSMEVKTFFDVIIHFDETRASVF